MIDDTIASIFLFYMENIILEKNNKKVEISHKEWIQKIISKSEDRHKIFIAKAVENFVDRPMNCCEAVADAISEYEQSDKHITIGMVSGFGKGVAGKAQMCGVLLTGISFISKTAFENGYDKKKIREFSSQFYERFINEFGSNQCSVLSGHDCDEPFSSDFDLNTCGKYIAFTTKEILSFKDTNRSTK